MHTFVLKTWVLRDRMDCKGLPAHLTGKGCWIIYTALWEGEYCRPLALCLQNGRRKRCNLRSSWRVSSGVVSQA